MLYTMKKLVAISSVVGVVAINDSDPGGPSDETLGEAATNETVLAVATLCKDSNSADFQLEDWKPIFELLSTFNGGEQLQSYQIVCLAEAAVSDAAQGATKDQDDPCTFLVDTLKTIVTENAASDDPKSFDDLLGCENPDAGPGGPSDETLTNAAGDDTALAVANLCKDTDGENFPYEAWRGIFQAVSDFNGGEQLETYQIVCLANAAVSDGAQAAIADLEDNEKCSFLVTTLVQILTENANSDAPKSLDALLGCTDPDAEPPKKKKGNKGKKGKKGC